MNIQYIGTCVRPCVGHCTLYCDYRTRIVPLKQVGYGDETIISVWTPEWRRMLVGSELNLHEF